MKFAYLSLMLIDIFRGTRVISKYKELSRLQFSTPSEVRKRQQKALANYFSKLLKKTDRYKLASSIEEIEIADKKWIRDNQWRLINKSARRKILRRTGGSTGEPFEYYTTTLAQSYLWAGIFLSWQVAGYNLGDRAVFLGGASILGKRNLLKKLFFRLQNIFVIDCFEKQFDLSKKSVLEIYKIRPKYIYGYGNILFEIAKDLKARGVPPPPGIQGIISTADPLTQNMRLVIEDFFLCPVFNQYGSNDAGVSAFECEKRNGFHLITERCYLETDGEGNFISTDMKNYAMAMARYKFGDIGSITWDSCECGRGYPRIINLQGRSNDVLRLYAGGVIHSSFFSYFLKKEVDIKQWQVTKRNEVIKINIIGLHPEKHAAFIKKYQAAISNELGDVLVCIVFDEDIAKTKVGKFRFVIDFDESLN